MIWVIWFLNQVVVYVILLNFLVGVIIQSYESVLNSSIILKYKQRCELNRECAIYLDSLYTSSRRNCSIISVSSAGDDLRHSEWSGFVQALKRFIKSEN